MTRKKQPVASPAGRAEMQSPFGAEGIASNPERLLSALEIDGKNLEFYRTALTHRSAAGVSFTGDRPATEPNERLEFLGDALIGALSAEELYRRYPDEPEGILTQGRSAIVRTEQLAAWAQEIALDEFMYMAPGERASVSGRDRILAGAYEALIGAIYLDRGLSVARAFFNRQLRRDLGAVLASVATSNPKGRLQEITQSLHRRAPAYRTINAEGPAHDRNFTVEVCFNGELLATGSGSSKRNAEEAAAAAALALIDENGTGILSSRPGSNRGN